MADETQEQLEVTISQPTPEAVSQAGQFTDAEKQASWTQVTDPYRISQKDSATMESLTDEKIDEIKAKGGFQKFELFDGTLLAEAQTAKDRKSALPKAQPGEYVTVQTKDGKLKIPQGNPAFGDPTNFEAYSKNVNEYVKWIETWNGNSYGWNRMNDKQKEDFANSLRHSLGIGYLVFQGMPKEFAVNKALDHETGDASLDSKQDRHNNIWAAETADKMASEGKTWYDFVAKTTYAASEAAFHHNGFLK